MRINLATNKVERIYPMKGVTDQNSYINDVRVDTKRQVAYMTNSNEGGIVVVDLKSGKTRMVLKGAPPTQTDPAYHFMIGGREVAPGGKPLKVNSDGIALSPDREWLFFKPLTDDKLYKDQDRRPAQRQAQRGGFGQGGRRFGHVSITDGMEFDKKGNLYFGDMEHNTILRITADPKKTVLVEDSRLLWPDSYAVSKDGYLYISTSEVQTAPPFNNGADTRTLPYGLFRLRDRSLTTGRRSGFSPEVTLPENDAETRVFAKVRGRLVPILMLGYFVAFLDRVNIGFASLQMNHDLGFGPTVYGTGAGIFFIGYFLCEVPSNVMLELKGARVWIARIMISWGLVSMATAAVRGVVSFHVARFALGAAEAGFYPGVILI